jgi:hypothetical protein
VDDLGRIRKVFQISGANQEEVAQRITANLEMHQQQTPDTWPEFAIQLAKSGGDPSLHADAYASLAQASQAYNKVWVSPASINSRIPLMSGLKQAFHQLVVYYVNQLGERQMTFNDRILRVVNHLVQGHTIQDAEIAALRQQVDDLQARLEKVESVNQKQ